ncbi:sugar phosphate isomerase/epimerase [Bifidobacterium sp. ESL0775]|uniref:sugar phosphate isomerase/epimerase family protein n=1 Tax=Bifidobacterium sp. ESL0775 TaxID=2983230 RepID=UPI0023F69833|nr:sugar phosphate isomerase/epimerase family protein [Bifidobacterium sp. ESL0775]WEV68798.1 sugar phosphate isomerase/epimerase [Bifidobacterium sp. ESL0775]
MKIGFNEATARDCSDLQTDLELAEKYGFDAIEIRLDMLRNYLKDHSVDELADFFKHSRVRPHAMNALYIYEDLFTDHDDPAKHQEVMDDFQLGCETAQRIGSKTFIVVAPLHRNPEVEGIYDTPWETIFANCVRILKKLGDMAAKYDVKLCLESVGHEYSSIRTVEQASDIVNAVDKDNVGLVFDACNLYLYHQLQDFSVMELADPKKVFDVHINDADDRPMEGLTQTNRCFCGTGDIDLQDFLRVLKRIGYSGVVSIETFRPDYWKESPEWVFSHAYKTTRDAMEKAGVAE